MRSGAAAGTCAPKWNLAQHTAQHGTARHSAAQHSTARRSSHLVQQVVQRQGAGGGGCGVAERLGQAAHRVAAAGRVRACGMGRRRRRGVSRKTAPSTAAARASVALGQCGSQRRGPRCQHAGGSSRQRGMPHLPLRPPSGHHLAPPAAAIWSCWMQCIRASAQGAHRSGCRACSIHTSQQL